MRLPEKAFYSIALFVLMLGSTTTFAATFDGYECTDDCSGHQAGYEWAEEKGIYDENSCSTHLSPLTKAVSRLSKEAQALFQRTMMAMKKATMTNDRSPKRPRS